jgi:hypothetical protein
MAESADSKTFIASREQSKSSLEAFYLSAGIGCDRLSGPAVY